MSANTNLGSTPVNQGYVQLIHTGETGGISGTLRTLYDGDGTASDLQIASNAVKISTQLYIGSQTILEYIQEAVKDILVTNASHTNITATQDAGDKSIDLNASGEVTLTGTQTLTNKTLASPTFTGDILFNDASTPVFTVKDTTNNVQADWRATDTLSAIGTTTDNAFYLKQNGNFHVTINSNQIILNTQGEDRNTIIKDDSGTAVFKVDAGTSETIIGTLSVTGNATVTGDLQVNGTTTTVNQTNLDVSDNIIGLNRGAASNANDSGLIIERGSTGNNVFIGWKETNDRVLFGTTLAEADDTGDLTITDADIQANRLYGDVTGDVTGSLSGGTVTSLSSPIALSEGGTGGGSDSEARTNLGVAIGSDVQAYNSTLASVAGGTYTGDDSITTLGTIGTGVWQGTAIASAYLDADTAHLSGTQTFSGAKTFSSTITGSITGNAGTATALATARSITMSGEVSSGAVNFDGTAGVVIPNTTIGSGVIVDGSIASDAAIATSKLASNTISGVALGSNLNALTVGTGMAFASGSNYTGATARQINLNLSAIDHDSLGNYVDNEHIDWTTDQGAINIHAGNYTDTNQLTTFVIQDGDTTNVTISQGKYVKFQALTNGGLDIDWASSLGAGSSGDPYDLQFKIDLSNMGALVDTLESGDNLLVYNADEGTALAPVSEIQSALNIPSASGTTDGVVTLNANGTLTGEAELTYNGAGQLEINRSGSNAILQLRSDTNNTRIHFKEGSDIAWNIGYDATNNWFSFYDSSVPATPVKIKDGAGSDTLVVDSASRVGIGTASPQSILHVGTGNTARHIKVSDNRAMFGYNGADAIVQGGNTKGIEFHTNTDTFAGSAKMVIEAGGNVGIGETNPDSKLEVAGVIKASVAENNYAFEVENSTEPNFKYRIYNDGSTTGEPLTFRTGLYYGTTENSSIHFYRGASSVGGYMTFQTNNGNEKMRIDSSGNVGISTTSPNHLLEIEGQTNDTEVVQISNNAGGSGSVTGITHLGITHFPGNTYSSTRITAIENGTASYTGHLAFSTRSTNSDSAPAERMRITSAGNVGIGVVSPGVKLDVSGQARATNGMLVNNGTTAGFFTTDSDNVNFGASTSGKGLKLFSANTERLRIVSGGDAHFDQDVIAFSTTPSDKRLKDNIKDIEYGLDTIMKLSPKEYDWKKDDRHDIGFIAQEVEEVIPEIVKDKKHFDKDIKTLDYEKLTAVLIKAVQEQQEQINELKEKLNG